MKDYPHNLFFLITQSHCFQTIYARPHQITLSSGGSMPDGRSRISRVLKTVMTKDQIKQLSTITAERLSSVFQKQKHCFQKTKRSETMETETEMIPKIGEVRWQRERDNPTQSKSQSKSQSRDGLYLYIDYREKNPAAESESVPENPARV